MKRYTTIFLLGIYLLSFSEFHQFLKLPVLVQHFREHCQQNPSLTFIHYLKLHYVDDLVLDDDYQRDHELPFRTGDCLVNNYTSCECPALLMMSVTNHSTEAIHEFQVYDEDRKPFFAVADIFQPPRSTAHIL